MEKVVREVQLLESATSGTSATEKQALYKLKRGIYAKRDIKQGETISADDLYFSMPLVENQLDASKIDQVLDGFRCNIEISADSPITMYDFGSTDRKEKVDKIAHYIKGFLDANRIPIGSKDGAEISAHYGIDRFNEVGVFIINKINREYCKKILVVSPGQSHPTHHHIKKEECFELLSGDCMLILNNKNIALERGKPVLIPRGTKHSFMSRGGCIIEEVSTTHYPGDSVYEDPEINKLKLSERKYIVDNLSEY